MNLSNIIQQSRSTVELPKGLFTYDVMLSKVQKVKKTWQKGAENNQNESKISNISWRHMWTFPWRLKIERKKTLQLETNYGAWRRKVFFELLGGMCAFWRLSTKLKVFSALSIQVEIVVNIYIRRLKRKKRRKLLSATRKAFAAKENREKLFS